MDIIYEIARQRYTEHSIEFDRLIDALDDYDKHIKPKFDKLKAENDKLKQGITNAINIIADGGKIMTLDQLSKWEGYLGYIQWWEQELNDETM